MPTNPESQTLPKAELPKVEAQPTVNPSTQAIHPAESQSNTENKNEPPKPVEEIKSETQKEGADNGEESDPENLIKPSEYIDELDKNQAVPTNNPNDDDIINVQILLR